MKFKKLELLSEDLAGKDERKDINLNPEEVKLFDESSISEINNIIRYYTGEIKEIEKLISEFDKNATFIFKLLDKNITVDYLARQEYIAVIKKCLADLELIYNIGFNIFSTAVVKELTKIIGALKSEL